MKRKAQNGEGRQWIEDYLRNPGQECTPWPFGVFADGYAACEIDGKKKRISRYVCRRIHGDPETEKLDSAHSCGNGALGCFNPNHLRWDTRKGNFADKIKHDTHNRGERNPQHKLTEIEAREILAMKGNGEYHKDIAARYGVGRKTVDNIMNRKLWSWL